MSKTAQGLKTTDIKGKSYVEVNERIKYFRENYKNHALTTDIVSLENGVVIIKASVFNENDVLISTGHAYEKEGSTFINKTSYIENCETSAVGRCLGNLGIGIDTSVASYEEVENAIHQQNQPTKYDTTPQPTSQSEFSGLSEQEAYDLAIQKGLANVMKALNKDANVKYKPQVQKAMCEKYGVDKWVDIRFDDYNKFGNEVKSELDKLKEIEEAGL